MLNTGNFTLFDAALPWIGDGTGLIKVTTVNVVLVSSAENLLSSSAALYSDLQDELPNAGGYSQGGVVTGAALSRAGPISTFSLLLPSPAWQTIGNGLPAWRWWVVYVSGTLNGHTNPLIGFALGDATGIDVSAIPANNVVSIRVPAPLFQLQQANPGNVTPIPPQPTIRYRNAQQYLFQTARAATIPNRIAGGSDYLFEGSGAKVTVTPHAQYVCRQNGWKWANVSGDWIGADASHTPQGSTAWFTVPITTAGNYTADVTSALQYCQVNNKWVALILKNIGTTRVVAGKFSGTPPAISVTYTDSTTGTLACRITARDNNSSSFPSSTATTYSFPIFIEFERPDRAVSSANMSFTITDSNSASSVVGFVLNPPLTDNAVQVGLADAYVNDQGLESEAAIIGHQFYPVGGNIDDYVASQTALPDQNLDDEEAYDPAIYGNGATDLTKLPHAQLGKFVGPFGSAYNAEYSIVDSSYTGDGFQALEPSIASLRIKMPANTSIVDGSLISAGGQSYGTFHKIIMLPEAGVANSRRYGYADHIFVRYYIRLGTPNGTPYSMPVAKRYQVYQGAGNAVWTDCQGKTGIMPVSYSHPYGVNSGSSGGGNGWQMRLSWQDVDDDDTGPNIGGWCLGLHTFDYKKNNPPGFQYTNDPPELSEFGANGSGGGVLYANTWYCIELEMKLNSVSTTAPGFSADGEIRMWLDGKKMFERTGMVFRSLPLNYYTGDASVQGYGLAPTDPGYISGRIRPIRDVGITGLWFNWFHGGLTPNTVDRVLFISQLAYGTQYIGPMRTGPLWLVGKNVNQWVPVPNSTMGTQMLDFSIQYSQGLCSAPTVTSAAPGSFTIQRTDQLLQKLGGGQSTYTMGQPVASIYGNSGGTIREANSAILKFGGGGAESWCSNEVRALVLEQDTPQWITLNKPTRATELWWKSDAGSINGTGTPYNPRDPKYGYSKGFGDFDYPIVDFTDNNGVFHAKGAPITPELGYPGPVARHSYYGCHHDAVRDQFIAVKAAAIAPWDLYHVATIDTLPMGTLNWANPPSTFNTVKWDSPFLADGVTRRHPFIDANANALTLTPIIGQCKDPATQFIYAADATNIFRYDPASNAAILYYHLKAGDTAPSGNTWSHPQNIVVNTDQNELLMFWITYLTNALVVARFDLSVQNWPTASPRLADTTIYDNVGGTLTSKLGVFHDSNDGRGMCYDRGLKKVILILDELASGGTPVYTLARQNDGRYLMEQLTLDTSLGQPPAKSGWISDANARVAIRSHLSYVPNLGGICYSPNYNIPAYFIRTV